MNKIPSAATKKELIKNLKVYEGALTEEKSKKVINLEVIRFCKEQIEYLRNVLDLRNKKNKGKG